MAALDSDESIIWEERLPFPKVLGLSLLLCLFALAAVSAVGYLGYFQNAITVHIIVLVLVFWGILFLRLYRGVRFCITNRRILGTWDFFRWKKRWDLPLESLVEVVVKRDRGDSFVRFKLSSGLSEFMFGPIKDDAEQIRGNRSPCKVGVDCWSMRQTGIKPEVWPLASLLSQIRLFANKVLSNRAQSLS